MIERIIDLGMHSSLLEPRSSTLTDQERLAARVQNVRRAIHILGFAFIGIGATLGALVGGPIGMYFGIVITAGLHIAFELAATNVLDRYTFQPLLEV